MSDRRSRTATLVLGSMTVTLTPHILERIGPRVLIAIDDGGTRCVYSTTPGDARQLAANLTLAACEAESYERREQRRKEQAA